MKKGYDHYAYPYLQEPPDREKWHILRTIGQKTITPEAQLKLEWIIFYHTLGNKKVVPTARHFGINPKTLHKWLARFREDNLLSLEEHSRAPLHVRAWTVTMQEEQRIISLRKQYMMLGKKKLAVLYQEQYKETISAWKIERVIRSRQLYPQKRKHAYIVEKRAKNKTKMRIHTMKQTLKEIQEFGFLWHIDAIIVWWYGTRKVIFTAIEQHTRIAYAYVYKSNTSVYKSNTSAFAEDFLHKLHMVSGGKIRMMHSDNGAEFQGAFQKACQTLGILQVYSRAYTPKDNAVLERFNRTIQEEWLAHSVIGLDDIQEANNDLLTWLIYYNSKRPHQALDYKTPLTYAQDTFFNVLPMWSARTLCCFFYLIL